MIKIYKIKKILIINNEKQFVSYLLFPLTI